MSGGSIKAKLCWSASGMWDMVGDYCCLGVVAFSRSGLLGTSCGLYMSHSLLEEIEMANGPLPPFLCHLLSNVVCPAQGHLFAIRRRAARILANTVLEGGCEHLTLGFITIDVRPKGQR